MAITPTAIRYIKLGRRGRWEVASLDRQELHFGHGKVSHKLALTLDREKIQNFRVSTGRDKRAAADDAREIIDFYSLDQRCLWITFARGHMWWTFAEPKVRWVGGGGDTQGERVRNCVERWKNFDLKNNPLAIETLSTKLTKVASYRRTICSIEHEEYLLRRINGIVEPLVLRTNQALHELADVTKKALAGLDWRDFETLVDIIFARSGWHRISALGGTQKSNDIILENPITGERCAVQIKSSADQKSLEKFVVQADETGKFNRVFFVCHSPKENLLMDERPDVHIWDAGTLSQTAIRLGLSNWIIERC